MEIRIKIDEALELYNSRHKERLNLKGLAEGLIENYKWDVKLMTILNYFSRNKEGEKSIPLKMIIDISEILGVSVNFLIGLEEEGLSDKDLIDDLIKLSDQINVKSKKLKQRQNC